MQMQIYASLMELDNGSGCQKDDWKILRDGKKVTFMELEEKKKIIEEILKYPTGNISDAMDNLGIRRGAVIGLMRSIRNQEKAAGFAASRSARHAAVRRMTEKIRHVRAELSIQRQSRMICS